MHSIYRRIVIGLSLCTSVSLQHIYLLLHCKFARNKKKFHIEIITIFIALQPLCWPWPFFQFLSPAQSWQNSFAGEGNPKVDTYTQDNTDMPGV
jgi:hypothetical protein